MVTQGTRKQTTEPIRGRSILGTNQLQPVEWESVGIFGNIPPLVSVDFIWKKNQVILELSIYIVLCKKIRNHNFVDSLDASIGI